MYMIKDGIELESLRKYGFKTGKEWCKKNNICNEYGFNGNRFFVFSTEYDVGYSESKDDIYFVDEGLPLWYMEIQEKFNNRIWIDMAPASTYHIDCFDTDKMFSTLFQMIKNGVIEDV